MSRRFKPDRDAIEWTGPTIRYDLVKEVTVCFVVVALLTVLLASLFSSPDDHSVTLQSWSSARPVDFVQTAAAELDGTSGTATYGPPYTTTENASQKLGPVSLQNLAGRRIPIDTKRAFVTGPLSTQSGSPALAAALERYDAAPGPQQLKWAMAYANATAKAKAVDGGTRVAVPRSNDGPVPQMMSSLLLMARSGALDGALLSSPQLYGTDYTKPLLFIADGTYLADLAAADHLQGDQWGMMNETGNYPGQAWLWLYTFWYQVKPWSTSDNGDVLVWGTMMVLTALLVLVPFIPGLRSIPRWSGVHRLIWRRHYRSTT
jgi:hypothetical protein